MSAILSFGSRIIFTLGWGSSDRGGRRIVAVVRSWWSSDRGGCVIVAVVGSWRLCDRGGRRIVAVIGSWRPLDRGGRISQYYLIVDLSEEQLS